MPNSGLSLSRYYTEQFILYYATFYSYKRCIYNVSNITLENVFAHPSPFNDYIYDRVHVAKKNFYRNIIIMKCIVMRYYFNISIKLVVLIRYDDDYAQICLTSYPSPLSSSSPLFFPLPLSHYIYIILYRYVYFRLVYQSIAICHAARGDPLDRHYLRVGPGGV